MQIVIDIPEEEYALCKKQWDTECLDTLMIAVKYGTSLPKGHGRLIEINTIQSMARKKAEDWFPEGRYDYGYRKALFDFAKDIEYAPTIIEADKAESEDEEW